MTGHYLDRAVFHALNTRQGAIAHGGTRARRFHPEISPFIGAADDSDESLAELAALVPAEGTVISARVGDQPVPQGIVAEHVLPGVQMVAETDTMPEGGFSFVELGDADVPEMVALATLTKPGPFLARTHHFGGYIGIRHEGKLVAMAGQRLQVPGYTEVSAVCTHPDFRGRGYGSFLLLTVAARIRARGETPFLHTFASNTGAIKLYEQLGYVLRSPISVTVMRRA